MQLIIRILVNAAALWVAAKLVDGIELTSSMVQILLVAIVFGLVNALIKPFFDFFALPFVVLTIGLFSIVVNAVMLNITDWIAPGLTVEGIGASLWGAIIIGFTSWALSMFSMFLVPSD